MRNRPIKIGVTGTHSTGKTSFFEAVERELQPQKLRVRRIGDFARKAKSVGFPILRDHTFESTLWIMAECLRCESEASLSSDLILVDRPAIDALGYLYAALQLSGRTIGDRRLRELTTIAAAHLPEYDLLIKTSLDNEIELGPGRDTDCEFREAAAESIDALVLDIAPHAETLSSSNRDEIVQRVCDLVTSRMATT